MLDGLLSRLRYELGNPRAAANARLEHERAERAIAAISMLAGRIPPRTGAPSDTDTAEPSSEPTTKAS